MLLGSSAMMSALYVLETESALSGSNYLAPQLFGSPAVPHDAKKPSPMNGFNKVENTSLQE